MKIKCKNECPNDEIRFDGCCSVCTDRDSCEDICDKNPQTCEDAIFEGSELEVFQNKAQAVIQKIGSLVKQKAKIEAAEKEMREQLQQAMETHSIKNFDNDIIKITYVEASSRSSVDSTKLKSKYPDIAAECVKTSAVKAFVKIELKGDEKK